MSLYVLTFYSFPLLLVHSCDESGILYFLLLPFRFYIPMHNTREGALGFWEAKGKEVAATHGTKHLMVQMPQNHGRRVQFHLVLLVPDDTINVGHVGY